MLNENAQKLVDALRSGKYPQSRGYLRTTSGYCCLGVACDIYRQETGNGEWEAVDDRGFQAFLDERFSLPDEVRAWLGFAHRDGFFTGESLASLNDDGYSFESIADTIESEPKRLFR